QRSRGAKSTKLAEVCVMGGNFVSYHWLLIKHVGRRISDKWRTEVFSSVGVGAIIFCISWVVGDAGALLAFKIALLANAIWLGIFAIIHIVRAPYLFHSKPELVVQARSAPLKVGLIGVLSLLAILV